MRRKDLKNRAKSKYISSHLAARLANLHSPLEKSYWNTFHCCNELTQEGKKLSSKYCNNRWCSTCNRIRTAKLIDGYVPELAKLHSKYFVTLTIPNCHSDDLFDYVELMASNFKKIKDRLRKKNIYLIGIRKIEITYNSEENSYHPHFHCIISGRKNVERLRDEWLKMFPDARRIAQDVRPADESAVKELFKYFTKLLSKSSKNKIYLTALDIIFQVMRGRRVFQPMGIRKHVSEDIEEIQTMIFEDLDEKNTLWKWDVDKLSNTACWYDVDTGEALIEYTPDRKTILLFDKILE